MQKLIQPLGFLINDRIGLLLSYYITFLEPNYPFSMEVHHHSGAHHEEKHFKDYFLEFLMIFLAVTMGFLAENLREYITDNNHVEELAGQLKEDLINDTTKLTHLIAFQQVQLRRADSLYEILTQPPANIDYKKLQNMIVDCDRLDFFYPSTGAMSTIKRDLHLRKFVKTKIAKHMDLYEKDIVVLEKFESRDIDYMGKYLESFVSSHFTPENITAAITRSPVVSATMRNLSPPDLVQLSVDINLIKAYNIRLLGQYEKTKADAVLFIQHINVTYSLDD
jgi:hypothetical protein